MSKERAEGLPGFWGNTCLEKNYVQLFALGSRDENAYVVCALEGYEEHIKCSSYQTQSFQGRLLEQPDMPMYSVLTDSVVSGKSY